MMENLYTTKMSGDKKKLQSRFLKIRSKSGRLSKVVSVFSAVLVVVALLIGTVVMASFEGTYKIQVFHNNEPIEFKNKPFFYNKTVYLPLRELFETLELTEKSEIKYDNGKIRLKIDGHYNDYEIKIGDNSIVYSYFFYGSDNRVSETLTPYEPVLLNRVTYIPFDYIAWILNRYNYDYDISFIFGEINSKLPYMDNAELMTYPAICDLQYQVDNGNFPWRISAEASVQTFTADIGNGNGVITEYTENETNCSATYVWGEKSYCIELFKPVQKDEHGIWVLRSLKETEAK